MHSRTSFGRNSKNTKVIKKHEDVERHDPFVIMWYGILKKKTRLPAMYHTTDESGRRNRVLF